MVREDRPASPSASRPLAAESPAAAAHGLRWLVCGSTLLRRRPALWLGMSALYLAAALALEHLPFLGHFLLILLSPVALAGSLGVARALARSAAPIPAAPADHAADEPAVARRRLAQELLYRPARALLAPLSTPTGALTMALTGIVTLGLSVVVAFFELVLTGGSLIAGLSTLKLGAPAGPFTPGYALSLGIAVALYVLLAMALLYLVPLAVFGARPVITAAIDSLRACTAHARALAVFSAPFLLLDAGILAAFDWRPALGYALVFTLGLAALPAFVAGLYCSYSALFESSPATPAAG